MQAYGEGLGTCVIDRCQGVIAQCGRPKPVCSRAIDQDNPHAVFEPNDLHPRLVLPIQERDVVGARTGGVDGYWHLAIVFRYPIGRDRGASDGEFGNLTDWGPQNKHLLAVDHCICQNLRRGVEQALVAELEVGDDNFSLVAIDGNRGLDSLSFELRVLWNRDCVALCDQHPLAAVISLTTYKLPPRC